MNVRCKFFLALLMCFAALGCATPQTSELEKPTGDPYIYVFDDEAKVFNIAYHALGREVDKNLIKDLNGPVKGYYAQKESWGGNSNYWIRIFAANGVNQNGRNTYGYYGEVMVEGDKGNERDSARKIFSDMEAMFGQQGEKVYVRNLARAKYRNETIADARGGGGYDFDSAPRQQPRIPASQVAAPVASVPTPDPALAEPAKGEYVQMPRQQPQARPMQQGGAPAGGYGAPSMADELVKLNELREKGIISDADFQKAKDRILSNW